jgi:hypothetical protein
MIVWGGQDYLVPLDSGGRYDPVDDSWSETSTGVGVPRERTSATAIWTGKEMIVWGGEVLMTGIFLDTGGRYDPLTDSWTETSTAAGVPTRRRDHAAIWTGTRMLVWGGHDLGADGGYPNGVGIYCDCGGETVGNWYPDADGDGFGVDSTAVASCEQPPGYVASGGDCDDRNAGTHPGAEEINDGLDNQCPGDDGYGLVDEITGVCGFHKPADTNEFSCPLQSGATRYEVARSPHPEFPSWVGCLRIVSDAATWVDSEPVPEGTCFYYLVRSHEPNMGSWGAERTVTCHR